MKDVNRIGINIVIYFCITLIAGLLLAIVIGNDAGSVTEIGLLK